MTYLYTALAPVAEPADEYPTWPYYWPRPIDWPTLDWEDFEWDEFEWDEIEWDEWEWEGTDWIDIPYEDIAWDEIRWQDYGWYWAPPGIEPEDVPFVGEFTELPGNVVEEEDDPDDDLPTQGEFDPEWGEDRPPDDLYAYGGQAGDTKTLSNEGYSISGNAWTVHADMPFPARTAHGGASVRHFAYSFGGNSDVGFLRFTTFYDPVEDVWAAKRVMPRENYGGGACSLGIADVAQEAVVFGGMYPRPRSTTSSSWQEV